MNETAQFNEWLQATINEHARTVLSPELPAGAYWLQYNEADIGAELFKDEALKAQIMRAVVDAASRVQDARRKQYRAQAAELLARAEGAP